VLPAWLSFNTNTRTFSGAPPQDFNGALDLKVTASDGALSASDTFSLTIQPVNDAPVVGNPIADQSSPEDQAWSFQVPSNTFSDVDSGTLSYTATLGNGDVLPAWLSFNTNTRTFSGMPPQDFNGALDLKVTAGDGALSASDTFSLTIQPVNDAPVVATSGGTTEATGQVAVVLDAGVTVSDVDNTTLTSATVSITGNFHAGEDLLAFSNNGSTMGNIAGNYNAATGVLSLSSSGGTATLAQWQAALRAVTYFDLTSAPNTAVRTVAFQIDDGQAVNHASTTSDKTISVVAGTSGSDTIPGTEGPDTLDGLNGDDLLEGLLGDDHLNGGAGNDLLFGGGGNDVLTGGADGDFMDSGGGTDSLDGGDGFDIASWLSEANGVTLNLANQSLNAGSAAGDTVDNVEAFYLTNSADNFIGGSTGMFVYSFGGDDTFIGSSQSDFLDGGAGADTIDAGSGFDYVSYNSASDGVTLDLRAPANNTGDAAGDAITNAEAYILTEFNDTFIGLDAGQNIVSGYGGNDTLTGGFNANNWFFGGDGNDRMMGGGVADLCVGGNGADTIVPVTPTPIAGSSVFGFETGVDQIEISRSAFGLSAGYAVTAGSTFAAGTSPTNMVASPTFLYYTDLGLLYFDPDGTGATAATLLMQLAGASALAASDFHLV
jgi:Ca2+-binding RTX toxin-like protein